ncbi:hypothetical protein CHS0354_040121 [Potamilus streckersoni]|uniref:Uncharacterized protein n=1 Tax=Potamilus streckersoni TaxID=2493646 RepID=A0AAE0SSN8_9BIVA|nr:hypothetical protein CHS0354_040121 [Potamilus streckersoni]
MSTGSFDDSSNLVVTLSSPTNEEKEEVFSHATEKESQVHHAVSAPKKSKGFRFFKRVKSPLKSPIKSPLKSPFKSHSKSPSKPPSKSPSTENLTEEFTNLDQRLKEKTSEEWQAFHEMQERIKQTVLKTQTSLSKYSGDSSASGDSEYTDSPKKTGLAKWADFDDNSTLALEELDNSKLNPTINISWTSSDIDNAFEQNYLERSGGLFCLETIPGVSPPISPGPPVNSRSSSLENLLSEEAQGIKTRMADVPEVDLLGLSVDDSHGDNRTDGNAMSLTQDLLSLTGDNYDPDESKSNGCSSSYTHDAFIMEASGGKISVGGTGKTQSLEGYSYSIPSVKSQSHKLSQRSTPFDLVQECSSLGGEVELSGDNLNQTKASSIQTSDVMSSLVDEFLDLGKDSPSSSPRLSSSPGIHLGADSRSALSESLPVVSSTFSTLSYGQPARSTVEQDIMAKIIRNSPSKAPTSLPKQTQEAAPKKLDEPFGFVATEISKRLDHSATADSQNKKNRKEEQESKSATRVNHTSKDSVYKNPFFKDDIESEQGTDFISAFNEDPFKTEIFDIASEADGVNASFGDVWDSNRVDKNADQKVENEFNDLDKAWEALNQNKSKSAYTAWDTGSSNWTVDSIHIESIKNPFQDDFSTMENITVDTSAFIDNDGPLSVENNGLNPFLSGDFMDSSTIQAPPPGSSNPFLEFCNEFVESKTEVSDFDKIFGGSAGESHWEEAAPAMDDNFDPFRVSSSEEKPSRTAAAPDDMDFFAGFSSTSDHETVRSMGEDKDFMLEIKPALETGDVFREPPPALKPPPRLSRSPKPLRENPFDRDSPPEENFARFEIMDNDKPKEPIKSISTTSTFSSTEEEEIIEPLEDFHPIFEKEGWKLMLRYPTKKKITGNRYWKNVFVKIEKQNEGPPIIKVYSDDNEVTSIQELVLQPCYSLSEMALQQYDHYGKIHTLKVQYVFYRERVGLRAERITPSFVRKPKATMILDHSPQVSELLKFGSLDRDELATFVIEVEDALMHLEAHREKTLTYNKDEVTVELWDEYKAEIGTDGKVLSQKARVRIFVLAFVTGMPICQIGINDRRRRGKEVVGRHDIIPIKTEEWIKLENVEFHCSVDVAEFERSNNILFRPLDGCQFELIRYRVRPRSNKELPLQLTIQQIVKDRRVEIRCDLLVTGYHAYSKKHGQFPCEDIEVHFTIPEPWIYLLRYERRFGYGSIKSATRKPGKIKGLERLTMMAQGTITPALMEADVGVAKYEHVYRAVVWRIARLPERSHGAYKSHLFKLKLELGQHDIIPTTFQESTDVYFTMPCSTVSQSQIRSVSVQNPNPPEKWVRYIAKYHYKVQINHLKEFPENIPFDEGIKKEVTEKGSEEIDDSNEDEEEEEEENKHVVDSDDSSD